MARYIVVDFTDDWDQPGGQEAYLDGDDACVAVMDALGNLTIRGGFDDHNAARVLGATAHEVYPVGEEPETA